VRTLLGPVLAPEWRGIEGKLVEGRPLVEDEAAFLLGATDRPVTVSLPAPGFVAELGGGEAEAGAQLAGIVAAEVVRLAADGVRHVLLHDPLYPFLLTADGRAAAGVDPDAALDRALAADLAVLDAVRAAPEVPAEFRISLDTTTSGIAPLAGGYDRAAVSRFLAGQTYDRLCVEYPVAEAGHFPLDLVGPGRTISLGLVDVGSADLEEVDDLLARVDEIVTVLDVDDIAIAPNGRFVDGPVGEAVQWQKLQLVETVARYYWGNEL
jgi:5-methyltetrahydropteroyltriglutamate--homocysteine methyltransferase